MSRLMLWLLCTALFSSSDLVLAQMQSTSNTQAAQFAVQSITALTGGNSISDVTLRGSVTWTAGSDNQTGTATLLASGTGESRMDLVLSGGRLTEIRDASNGVSRGKWVAPSGTSGKISSHNCQTDAVWFFPALSSLALKPNVVLSYVGRETRKGVTVQHIRSTCNNPVGPIPPSNG